MRQRILGWIVLGSFGGMAAAGLFMMALPGQRMSLGPWPLALVGLGLAGVVLQQMWASRKRR
jgi:hypothetical protein